MGWAAEAKAAPPGLGADTVKSPRKGPQPWLSPEQETVARTTLTELAATEGRVRASPTGLLGSCAPRGGS